MATATKTRAKAKTTLLKNSPEEIELLYKIATSTSSTREQLNKAWKATKSTRVRKAIASHGNADINILKMSARLYLKEVLNNPSFEFMELFDDESGFIAKIKSCYIDPKKFFNSGNYVPYNEQALFLRTALMSPKLDYDTLSNRILPNLSSDSFKRELNDKEVYNRVKALVEGQISKVDISVHKNNYKIDLHDLYERGRRSPSSHVSHLFLFYKAGLIPESSMYGLIYKYGTNCYFSGGSLSIVANLVLENLAKGDQDVVYIENATKLILMGNYSLCSSLKKKIFDNESLKPNREIYFRSLAKCLDFIVEMISEAGWNRVSWGNIVKTLFDELTEMVVLCTLGVEKKKEAKDHFTVDQLVSVHKALVKSGLDKYFPSFRQKILKIKDDVSLCNLNLCPQEVIEFYVYNNFVANKSILVSSSYANIVDLLNKINSEGDVDEMIFSSQNLSYFKEIAYSSNMMRLKSLHRYGIDFRKVPEIYESSENWNAKVYTTLFRKYVSPHTYVSPNPSVQRILNMTQ